MGVFVVRAVEWRTVHLCRARSELVQLGQEGGCRGAVCRCRSLGGGKGEVVRPVRGCGVRLGQVRAVCGGAGLVRQARAQTGAVGGRGGRGYRTTREGGEERGRCARACVEGV